MELTDSQIETLIKVAAAFEDAKRVTDLPDVADGVDPFTLYTEVMDSDGESKKVCLASLLPYIESEVAYGIQFDTSVSSTTCTRVGNTDLHKSLPVQSLMKGCLLDDDRNVVEYLNPADWTSSVRDGSRGQVMDELPLFYWKFVTSGTLREVWLSLYPLPGYTQVPKRYIGAYKASLDRTNLKLASVVNFTEQYRGGNNSSSYDDDENVSLLGRPATSISRVNFQKYARNRGDIWNAMLYNYSKEIYWLFAVEYATLNSQLAYNAELTSEGYRQGGLGAGGTNVNYTSWTTLNGRNPLVPNGYTDSLGNGTGCIDYTFQYADGTEVTVSANRYRGIEMPFGHIWEWCADVNIVVSPDEEDGGDGTSKAYVADDLSVLSDTGVEGYRYVGEVPRTTEKYITEILFGEYGDILAKSVGGSSSTYFCDYWWCAIPTTETVYGLSLGGSAAYSTPAGLVAEYTNYVPSASNANIGSRLCC